MASKLSIANSLHCCVWSMFCMRCEQKIIVNTFRELWFASVDPTCQDADAVYGRRTSIIIDIMAHCRTSGYCSFEQLLQNVCHYQLTASSQFHCYVSTLLFVALPWRLFSPTTFVSDSARLLRIFCLLWMFFIVFCNCLTNVKCESVCF